MVRDRADNLNCITSRDALLIATDHHRPMPQVASSACASARHESSRTFAANFVATRQWRRSLLSSKP
jgi:hypothetical protein